MPLKFPEDVLTLVEETKEALDQGQKADAEDLLRRLADYADHRPEIKNWRDDLRTAANRVQMGRAEKAVEILDQFEDDLPS